MVFLALGEGWGISSPRWTFICLVKHHKLILDLNVEFNPASKVFSCVAYLQMHCSERGG